jgi:hypothetical protein
VLLSNVVFDGLTRAPNRARGFAKQLIALQGRAPETSRQVW